MAAEFDSLLARSAASTGWAAGEGVPDQLEGANYTYDARWRLSSRTVINATAPDAMTGYIHDLGDHIIAETDAIGATQREYIWLDDLPVAAVDGAARSPVIYYVHTDHLQRPVAMTNARQSIAWSATYTPFGAVQTITTLATNLNLRFPGQLFQLETGLHYNWHRHYDPTTGRYLQPDPLIVDDGAASIRGLSTVLTEATSAVGKDALIAGTMGIPRASARALLPDGPSVYGYARQSPLTNTDMSGMISGNFSPVPLFNNLCVQQVAKKGPAYRCQSVIFVAPTGTTTAPLCPSGAEKLLNGTPTLLENGTLLPGGTNLFPDK